MVNELELVTNHVSSSWTNDLLFWTKIAGSQGNVLMGRRSIVVYFELCQNLQPEPNHMMDNTDWNTKNSRKYLSWIDMKNISTWKIFQSVLQQASSLMSHGEDHLLSTIQVRVSTIFSIITILCQSWHNTGQLHKPQQGINLSENWIWMARG